MGSGRDRVVNRLSEKYDEMAKGKCYKITGYTHLFGDSGDRPSCKTTC